MRKWIMGAVGAAMIVMGATPAWAEPTAHDRIEAKKRYDEAVDLYSKGDKDHARLAFIEAYRIAPFPDLTWGLAVIQVKTKHWVEAIPPLREVIADPTNTKTFEGEPKPRKDIAADYLAQIFTRVGRIRVAAHAGSTIYVNDAAAVIDNGTVVAMPGPVTVRVDGVSQQVTVVKEAVADADFIKTGSPPAVIHQATEQPPTPASSEATLPIVVKAPERAATAPKTTDHTLITATFIVGGGALLMGAGYVLSAVEAQAKGHAAMQLQGSIPAGGCPNSSACQSLRSDWSARKPWALAADTLGATSIALVVGTGILGGLAWHSSREGEPSHDAVLVPVVAPGFAGLSFSRSF